MGGKWSHFGSHKKSTWTQFFPLISKKRVGGDGAARVAFCGWFISTRGELQPWCTLSSKCWHISISSYCFLASCLTVGPCCMQEMCCFVKVWPQEIIQARLQVSLLSLWRTLKYHQHSHPRACHWLTEREISCRKVINSFPLHTTG